MKLVVQRVTEASVTVDGTTVGSITHGLCALVGITHTDTHAQCRWMADKLLSLRVFADDVGKMNRSLRETGGGILLVSQFTLYGDLSKGTRPSYIDAARPEHAEPLFALFVELVQERAAENQLPIQVATGVFGTMMRVRLVNDGPVTLILEK